MTIKTWLRRTSFILLSCGAMALSAQAEEDNPQSYDLEIDALPLMAAVKTLSDETGIEVLFFSEIAEGVTSAPVQGEYTPNEALETMLASTDLEVVDLDKDGAVAIRPIKEAQEPGKFQPASSLVLMAQNQTSAEQSQTSSGNETRKEENEVAPTFEEIVVTGTHIRGVGASVGTNVITIDRTDIELSGAPTVQNIMERFPLNFKGGPNEDTNPVAGSNFSEGSSINLRGLGAASTLTLINGRRIPIAGAAADFFDVSTIPASAVERIEVLTDGASAIYGSDAIAGVVNVILRKDFEGAETQLRVGNVTDGSSEEYRFAQTFGKNWGSGNALISYEYYERGRLAVKDRPYIATDLRPFGGDDLSVTTSNPGNIMDPATGFATVAFAVPPGQDGTALTATDFLPAAAANLSDPLERADILGDQERHSVFATLSQEVGDKIEIFVEGRYNERDYQIEVPQLGSLIVVPASNAFFADPTDFGPFLVMGYSFEDDFNLPPAVGTVENYSGVLGANFELPNDWQIELYGSHGSEDTLRISHGSPDPAALRAALADSNPTTAFNPFADGSNTNPATLATLFYRENRISTVAEVTSASLVADGALFNAPGGSAKLSTGANFRKESFDRDIGSLSLALEQEVTAVFGELYVPLVSENNARPGLERLEVSVATRYEDYSGVSNGSTSDWKAGVMWSPVESLAIRGSWGTSFKVPNLASLDESTNQSAIVQLVDPADPTGVSFGVVQLGNNADVGNETATTWTLGFEFESSAIPGLGIDVGYFDIEFEDRINAPVFTTVLQNEAVYAARIIRNPTTAQLDVVCNDPTFILDPALCGLLPIASMIDARTKNSATTEVRGLDITLDYAFDTEKMGHFDLRLFGSYLLDFDESETPTAPTNDVLGTLGQPVELSLRNSLTWSNSKGLSATAFVNYTDSYRDNVSIPERKIDSWTTVDFTLRLELGEVFSSENQPLSGTTFLVSLLNAFDEDPPFANQIRGYDATNASPLARIIHEPVV